MQEVSASSNLKASSTSQGAPAAAVINMAALVAEDAAEISKLEELLQSMASKVADADKLERKVDGRETHIQSPCARNL
jgi:hypothetical protein